MEHYRESTYSQMKAAIAFMDRLPINNPGNSLWRCLHQVVWHKAVDRVRWLLENKELVEEIAGHTYHLPDDLKERFWDSVYELKRLDR
jgi:hypothetical protein